MICYYAQLSFSCSAHPSIISCTNASGWEKRFAIDDVVCYVILSNGGGNANIKRINYAIKMISRCAVIKSCLQLYTHTSRRCTLILDGCKVKDYIYTHILHIRATPTKVRFILINHYITSYRFSSRFHAHGFFIPLLFIIIIVSIRFLFHRTHKHELLRKTQRKFLHALDTTHFVPSASFMCVFVCVRRNETIRRLNHRVNE